VTGCDDTAFEYNEGRKTRLGADVDIERIREIGPNVIRHSIHSARAIERSEMTSPRIEIAVSIDRIRPQ
jgi:hypothetical protein